MQLTLGLETWDLSYFNPILVYPSDYQSPSTGKFHKGETNMGGFMCFSWKAFEEGNAILHDKINLGLHEFSHALRFNGVKGHATDYFFEHYFARWLACAYSEFKKLKDNIPESIFRKYGGVNIEEFFSVAVETFFETPVEFKAALPELYRQTSILLNQTFSDAGSVIIDCRETLMKEGNFKLTRDYREAMRFRIGYNKLAISSAVFLLIGIFSMMYKGYQYPISYAMFVAAAILWLYFESQYMRVSFGKEEIRASRGYLILKNWRTFSIPYSHLISFKLADGNGASREGSESNPAGIASLVYYKDGDFYKEDLHITAVQPAFDALCRELKRNTIFVAMKD